MSASPTRRHRMSARDRQILAAAYLPVIAFGAVLIGRANLRVHADTSYRQLSR